MSRNAPPPPAPHSIPGMQARVVDHPLVADAVAALRNHATPSPVFRARMRALGALLLAEATRNLPMQMRQVQTPLATTEVPALRNPLPCLISILSAGDGLLAGMQDLLPDAPVGKIGLYRDEETLRPVEYNVRLPPDLAGRMAIIADPMLATGGTAVAAVSRLKQAGAVGIRFLAALAAPEGVARLAQAHPDVQLYLGALDEKLNEHGFIVPGLGDAGDRLFGTDGTAP